ADVSDGINVFDSGPGGDQYFTAVEVMRPIQDPEHIINNILHWSQTARTICPACHLTNLGFNHVNAAIDQRLKVGLDGWMIPHSVINGGYKNDGRRNGKRKCLEKIAGDARRKSRNAIRSRRSNEEEIDRLCDKDVIERAFEIAAGVRALEYIDVDLMPG